MTDASEPTTPPADPAKPAASTAPVPAAPTGAQPAGDPTARIAHLEAELSKANREAAGYRTRNKGELADFRKQLASVFGGPEGATQAGDPAAILAQIQKERADEKLELRRVRVDLALNELYVKHGVVPELTRAMLNHKGSLGEFDPADGEFNKKLSDAVKRIAEDYPQVKASPSLAPTAPRSGGNFPGGNNAANPQLTREELAGMSPEAINAAREKGQLNHLLGRH